MSLIRNYWQTASKESVLLSQQLVDTNAHITVSAVQPVTFRGPHECGTYPSLKLRAEECWRGASRERSAQAMAEAGSVPPPRARFRRERMTASQILWPTSLAPTTLAQHPQLAKGRCSTRRWETRAATPQPWRLARPAMPRTLLIAGKPSA